MLNPIDNSGKLALDARELDSLRQSARQNSPESVRAAAQQFEALFVNMMLKSMREATPQEGMFDNQQTRMYTSMLDQKLSQTMASRGIGLADVLVRQLSASRGVQPGDIAEQTQEMQLPRHATLPDGSTRPSLLTPERHARIEEFRAQMRLAGENGITSGLDAAAQADRPRSRHAHVRAFEDRMAHHAEEASRATGIPARFMLGQAALETGWGQREIRGADGANSHNLFGIKAGAGWPGRVVEVPTTEYINGVRQTRVEKFRAYGSYEESFRDYARLLTTNPRYENVIAGARDASSFAHGLQRAGYATDPNYAAKLTRIIEHTLSA